MTFPADGGAGFFVDVPGDIPGTAEIEGAQAGQAVSFKVGGAAVPQAGAWQTGGYTRQDLTVPLGADVAVTVDNGVSAAYPTTTLGYVVNVENRSTVQATGLVVEVTLPDHVTLVTADGATAAGRVLSWPGVELAGGATLSRTVTVQVDTTFPQGTDSIVATARVQHDGAEGIDPDPTNDIAYDTDTLLVPPDFAVAAADLVLSPAQPVAGQIVTVTLTVHNPGFIAGTAPVVLYDGPLGTGTLIGSQMVTVAAGGTATVTSSFVATASSVVISAAVDPDNEVVEVDERNNTVQRFLADVPDLAVGIDNVAIAPADPHGGDTVSMSVTIRNGGRAAASTVPLAVYDGEPENGGTLIFSDTSGALPRGGNRTVTLSWTATEGPHLLTVVVDPADQVVEVSEENNRVTKTVNVDRAAGPDLVVEALDLASFAQSSATLVAAGTIRATVRNAGNAAAGGAIAVRVFEDRDGSGGFTAGDRELGRQAIAGGLAAGASAVASLSVQGGLEFYHSPLIVEVDPEDEIVEQREDNNLASCFAACEILPPASLLPIVEKWSLPGVEVETPPVVVQLSDDNGDGRIDGGDVADVVFHLEDAAGRAVTARSGLDGSELWTVRSVLGNGVAGRLASAAAADLDGDGVAEILVALAGKLGALDRTGGALWVSDPVEGVTTNSWGGAASVADLDRDGVPDIVVGRTVLANDGRRIAVGTANKGEPYNYYGSLGYPYPTTDVPQLSVVADVDLDGQAEIVAGDAVYRLVGGQLQVVWNYTVPDNLMRDGFSAVANLDGDPEAEIVYVSSGLVMVFNHDGTVKTNYRRLINLSQFVPPTYWGGPPTIADLDGDGVPEILVAGDTELVAMRANLGTYWRRAVDDRGSVTGVTVFDLDADGFPEVLFGDQSKLWILDGRTGSPRHSQTNLSKTGSEYPVVADLDHDGRVELLVASNRSFGGDVSTQGLHVLTGAGWSGSRPIWNQYAYHVTNVQLDGTVPSPETPSWQADNTYRVNAREPREPQRLPNATLGLPRVGASAPTGIPVTLRVGSAGRASLPKGLVLRLHAGADPQSAPVVGEGATSRALAPGEWEDVVVVWSEPAGAGSPGSAAIDPGATLLECDESDNAVGFALVESAFPDLVIPAGGVTLPASPLAGQKLAVQVAVTNQGPTPAAASVLRLYDGPPSLGRQAGETALPGLAPGETRTLSVDWDAPGATGRRLVFAVADAAETVVELDEGNNEGFATVTLAEPTKPDLALEVLTLVPAQVTTGTPVALQAEVLNRGSALAGGTEVSIRLNNAEVARLPIAGGVERGARRTVSTTLQTHALIGQLLVEAKVDPANAVVEQNETNNARTATLVVQGSGLVASVQTDKLTYASNAAVALTVTTQNSAAARTALLKVTIQDGAGAVVAVVTEQQVSLAPGGASFTAGWNTGATAAGPYLAVAELVEDGAVAARGTMAFSIAADRLASAQVFTDRSEYEPDQTVAVTARLRNAGVNASLANVAAKLEIRNPGGAVVWSSTQTIPLLAPGAEAAVIGEWPAANAAPGVYTASVEAREQAPASPQLAYAATQFTVLDSAQTGTGLTGELAVSPSPAGVGTVLVAQVVTRNGGNAAMPGLQLRLRLVRLSDGVESVVQEVAWPLERDEQRAGTLAVPTAGLGEGDYQVKLDAVLPTRTVTLASADLSLMRGVSIADAAVGEGDGGSTTATFEVRLSSVAAETVTVEFTTADGTATAGSDYENASGTLTFAPGETTQSIVVSVHGDSAAEPDEAFLVTLSNPVAVALADGEAVGTIRDEEGCASPNLLRNPGAEDDDGQLGVPGWTLASGAWTRRQADPGALDGAAAFAAVGGETAELFQDVDLSPFVGFIDGAGLSLGLEAFVRSGATAPGTAARLLVELRDAAGTAVLATYDSGAVGTSDAWQPVAAAITPPVGARLARVRIVAARPGDAGAVLFDRLGLRSLGVPVLTAEGAEASEGNTGTTPLEIRATLSCSPAELTATYATQPETATPDIDYDSAAGTLIFSAAATTQTLQVAVRGDLADEPDETMQVAFAGGPGVAVLTPRVAGTIRDDDGPVALSIADATATEGDAGTAEVLLTVSLSDESGQEVRVAYSTAPGTASTGDDFLAASGTLVFPPGTTTRTIAVSVRGDLVDEPDESFLVRLSSPVHATLADAEADARIEDDDEVLLAVGDVRVVETDSGTIPASFTVNLSLPSVSPITVEYATADATATAPADYTATTGILTFAPGVTSQVVTVPVAGELVKEPEETFFLRLANPVNALLGRPEDMATVVDNDGILISVADVTVREGAVNAAAGFKVTLSKAFNQPIAVTYQTVDGTAQAGADYAAASGTVTFPVGSTLQTVNVTVFPDALQETPESFSLRLSEPTNGALLLRDTATATVVDGDLWTVNGAASDLLIPSCVVLTPDAVRVAGSAWRNERIDIGKSFDKTFKVFLGLKEGAEGIVFGLHNLSFQSLGGTDGAIGFSPLAPAIGVEVDTFKQSFDTTPHDHILFGVNSVAVSPTVPATSTQADVEDGHEHDLRVIWNAGTKELDVHFDGEERVRYQRDLVATLFGGASSLIYGLTASTGSLTNLQYFCETELCYGTAALPKVSIGDATAVVEPDSGTVTAIFPVTLACPTDHPVTVSYATADGIALAGVDFLATSGTLTFEPGETSKSLSVAVVGENVGEPDETFYLDLSSPAGGELRYARGVGTIVSDDATVAVDDVTTVEPSINGGKIAIEVRRVGQLASAVTVQYATVDGTAKAGLDYTATSGTLTFSAGQTSKQVYVVLLGDAVAESDEQFQLRLSNATNAEIVDGEALVSVLDDDDCPSPNLLRNGSGDAPLVNGEIPDWTEVVGNWFNSINCSPALAGRCVFALEPAAELRQDVDLSGFAGRIDQGGLRFRFEGFAITNNIAGELARLVVEYWSAGHGSLLARHDSGEFATALIWRQASAVTQVPAGTRWARVRLVSLGGASNHAPAFDGFSLVALGMPAVTIGDRSVLEGSAGTHVETLPLQLSCASTSSVRVDYLTQDGEARAGSDFEPRLGTIVFEPGEVTESAAVAVLGDTQSEGTESFFVNLASPVNAVLADTQGQMSLLDDEVSISVADDTELEGNSGTRPLELVVTLSGAIDQTVTVGYESREVTATAGSDFVAAAGTLTFNPGETSKVVQVDVLGDTLAEPNETFTLDLLEPVNAILARAQATGTILTDDLAISVRDAAIVEGNAGTVNAVFTVELETPSTTTVTVAYATRAESATAGADFTAASGTLTFAAGQTSKTIAVAVHGDTLQETSEVFIVELSNPTNAAILDGEGFGVIADDDGCPGPNLLVNPSGEQPLAATGQITGWTKVKGPWDTRVVGVGAMDGTKVFFAGSTADAELRQDVDISAYAPLVDRGAQRFLFQGFVRSAAENPSDPGHIEVDFLDAAKAVLSADDSGEITNTSSWQSITVLRAAPAGARFARVRLMARRLSAGNLDAYFDHLSLRSLDTPIVTFGERSLHEDAPGGLGRIALSLSCPAAIAPSVDVELTPGSAKAGLDFGTAPSSMTLPADGSPAYVEIPLVDDEVAEPLESFQLVVVGGPAVANLEPVATIAIVDDDPAPVVSMIPLRVVETDGNAVATAGLRLSNPSADRIELAFVTRNGSAVAGQDFLPVSGTVVFEPGEVSKDVAITILGDLLEEPEEQLYLQLSGYMGLSGPRDPIVVTVLDDDAGSDCPGPELVHNGGNEESLARGDQLASWTSAADRWTRGTALAPPEGRFHFSPPDLEQAVLFQDVDLSAYARFVDDGSMQLGLAASLASGGSAPADVAVIALEYRDAAGVVLGHFDTSDSVSLGAWQAVQHRLTAPVGTRSVRLSLVARKTAGGSGNDALFDRVSLRSLGVRSVGVGDVVVAEGAAVPASFELRLSCASTEPMTVEYTTVAGSASEGVDYTAADGTATFAPGALTAQVPVTVLDDLEVERTESFQLGLAERADLAVERTGLGIIQDDEQRAACTYQPPAGVFSPVLEWAWKGSPVEPTFDDVVSTPAVADLTGDGVAEIVFNSRASHEGWPERPGVLRAIDGSSGRTIFDVTDPALRTMSLTHIAVGDLDGDLVPEVVAIRYSPPGVMAFDAAGRLKWVNTAINTGSVGGPAIANVDGIGLPEVVVGAAVLNANGTLRWRVDERAAGPPGEPEFAGIVVAADLDLDGTQEIVAGNRAWTHAGAQLFNNGLADGYPAIGNFDADPYPEIVVTGGGRVRLQEHDGRLIWEVAPAGLVRGGAPTVADFDNDGQPEIGVAGYSVYLVLEGDGTTRWSTTIQDYSSNITGSAVFDFEGDGAAEVVYRDEQYLRVLRGSDGAPLFAVKNPSCTGSENPVIADVDGDGNAEIIVPRDQLCGYGPPIGVLDQGIFVFGDAADNWRGARPVWNQHAYSIGNVNDDASIPARPIPSWATGEPSTFRAQVPQGAISLAAPDLLPLQLAVDQGSCPSQVRLTATIANDGDAIVASPVGVTFYRGPQPGGAVLGTTSFTSILEAGDSDEVSVLIAAPGEQAQTLCVAIDSGSPPAVNECREQNNTLCIEVVDLCRPPAPDLAVADATVVEAEGAVTGARFAVTLSRAGASDVSVSYATGEGTATAGADFAAVSGTLVIPAGQTAATVVVPVLDDPTDEPDEGFTLALGAPVGVILTDATAVGTILDDDEPVPVLAASKLDELVEDRDGDGQPSPGDMLGYEIVIRNSGAAAARQVVLRDPVPVHTTLVAGSVTTDRGVVTSEEPVEVTIGSLAVGEAATVHFRVVVDAAVPLDSTEISNQGAVLSAELPTLLTDDPALGGPADPTITPITLTPKLVAEKTVVLSEDTDGDGVPSPGDTLAYTVRLLSVGNTTVTGVVLRDSVPANTTLIAGSVTASQGTVSGSDPVTVEVGDVAAGRTATVQLAVRIDNPIAAGVTQVSNQGTVESSNVPDLLTDDPAVGGEEDPTATVVAAAPLLAAEKTATLLTDADDNGYASPGDTLLYQVRITNRGNTAATDVRFDDASPAHVVLVPGSVQTSQGTVLDDDPVAVDLGPLLAGTTVEVTFRATIDASFPAAETAVSNQGRVTTAETGELLTDDPDTAAEADPTRTEVFVPVRISIGDTSLSEGGGQAQFPVTLDRAPNHPVTVAYALSDGTARAVEDYVDATGTLTIPAGATAATLPVEIVSDSLDEPSETLLVHLADPSIGTIVDGDAIGTIEDDDQPPLLAVDDVTVVEGHSGAASARFTVRLSAPTSFEVHVHFATVDGTAQAPGDYAAVSGDLVLPPGVVSGAIDVQVSGDELDEPDETFSVRLSGAVHVSLADGEGVGTILDDDLQAELAIADVEVREGDAGTVAAVFAVRLSSPAGHTVAVGFATSAITATAGADFVTTQGQLSFSPGEVEKTIAVAVNGDLLREPDETFSVVLSNPSGAVVGDGTGVGTILDDEICLGANLVLNPGAEERPVGSEIPGWTEVEGTQWLPRSTPPLPFEGLSSFWSGFAQYGEIRQDVDVAPFAATIDAGSQAFAFSARLHSLEEVPPDVGRVVIEYRDAANLVALQVFDSGDVADDRGWREVADSRFAPAGTRWVRIRLLTTRFTVGSNDSFFDAVSLRPLGTPAVTVNDVATYEGQSGVHDATFTVSLSCPYAQPVTVGYATANGTAQAPVDYQARTGSLTFPAGSTALGVAVPVVGDRVDEPSERFFLDLTLVPGSAGVVVADPRGIATIWNDDFCQLSPGYWKNHQSVWPVRELQLGGIWYYETKLLSFLKYSGSDASSILSHHLVATKLNLERGSDPTWGATPSVLPTVEQADLFLAAHPPGSNPTDADRDLAIQLKNVLDAYNNAGCRP